MSNTHHPVNPLLLFATVPFFMIVCLVIASVFNIGIAREETAQNNSYLAQVQDIRQAAFSQVKVACLAQKREAYLLEAKVINNSIQSSLPASFLDKNPDKLSPTESLHLLNYKLDKLAKEYQQQCVSSQ